MKKQEVLLYIDQYGNKYAAANRKELIKAVSPYSSPRVAIMYRDKKDGTTVRVGYVIGEFWCTAYKPVEIAANFS